MKKYHEFGVAKDNGNITGFFIKECSLTGTESPFFVPYDKFIELVKENEIQQMYWDSTLNRIGINEEEDVGQKQVKGRAKRAIAKALEVKDFDSYLRRDAVFHYNGESNVIPAAILLLSKVMFMNIATIIMPYTKEVEQMHQSFETKLVEYRKLFAKKSGGLVISVSVSLMEDVFTKIADLGYNIILCVESAENAIKTGYFESVSKPVSERILTTVDSIVTKLNYKASIRAFKPGTL